MDTNTVNFEQAILASGTGIITGNFRLKLHPRNFSLINEVINNPKDRNAKKALSYALNLNNKGIKNVIEFYKNFSIFLSVNNQFIGSVDIDITEYTEKGFKAQHQNSAQKLFEFNCEYVVEDDCAGTFYAYMNLDDWGGYREA